MSERTHPYDLVFGPIEQEVFPQIREEAEERGVDVRDRERFLMLTTVGALVREFKGLPSDFTSDSISYQAEMSLPAVSQFGSLVTHAFHHWLAGKQTRSISEVSMRGLLTDAQPIGSWDMIPPAPAGYIQLPRNLVFSRIDESAPPEAIDGFFFSMAGANDPAVPPIDRLDALFVLGLVPNRAGFSIIDVTATVTAEGTGHFGDAVAREAGTDFENVLPGGEGRLFAVTNTLEALKLVSRCFRRLAEPAA